MFVEFEIASLLTKATVTWTSVTSQWWFLFISKRQNRPIGDSEACSFSCWRQWLAENRSGARNWLREREGGNLEGVKRLQQNNRNHVGYIFYRLAMAIMTEKWNRAFFRHGGWLVFADIANLDPLFEVLEEVHGSTGRHWRYHWVCLLPLTQP